MRKVIDSLLVVCVDYLIFAWVEGRQGFDCGNVKKGMRGIESSLAFSTLVSF